MPCFESKRCHRYTPHWCNKCKCVRKIPKQQFKKPSQIKVDTIKRWISVCLLEAIPALYFGDGGQWDQWHLSRNLPESNIFFNFSKQTKKVPFYYILCMLLVPSKCHGSDFTIQNPSSATALAESITTIQPHLFSLWTVPSSCAGI